jgi:hypothetical protein
MRIDESARRELHARLSSAIGDEAASTLMEQLPPTSWEELATKDDLRELEQRLEAKLTAAFRAELNTAVTAQTRTTILATLGSAISVGTLVLTATQIG